jgi:serine/threonine protein kinase
MISYERPGKGPDLYISIGMLQQDLHRDELLAFLLAEAADQQRRGKEPDVKALTREYPDLSDELRQLLGIVQIVDMAGHSGETLLLPTSSSVNHQAAVLPRAFGDYELVEELGRGGMGVVYKAWEKSLKRFVALKLILRGEHASEVDLARFRGEAQAAAGLTHPNIVPVFKVDACDGQAFFSMKHVEGQTLAERIKPGPLRPRDAARYLAAVSRAVHHAHGKGILHRDLKPANILIDTEDQPLVTDFGLAKRVEGGAGLTGSGAIVGTPSYMSPEQASGEQGRIGPATDVYSLGAILYETLTGRPPFLAASAVATLLLVRTEEPVRPRLLNPQIDPDLEFICRKCLEKNPEHRYTSAAQLADDLEAFLKDEPVSARSSSLVYFVSRIFRESHHAPVQENWGVLWMWHSLTIFLLCAVTAAIYALGERRHWPYLILWTVGLVAWGTFFWQWRRRAGPVTFVERQIAHAWAGGVIASIGMFVVEVLLDLPVLRLSPLLGVIAGVVLLFKAGTLSGWFYIAAGLAFAVTIPMAFLPPAASLPLFGLVSAIGFFVPGWKYYRLRKRGQRTDTPEA